MTGARTNVGVFMETSGKKAREELKSLSRTPGAGSAATADRNTASSPHACPGHTACALAVSPQHPEPAELLQCHPPQLLPHRLVAPLGLLCWPSWLARLQGHTLRTRLQWPMDGLTCHKAAAFLTRENFSLQTTSDILLTHWQILLNKGTS